MAVTFAAMATAAARAGKSTYTPHPFRPLDTTTSIETPEHIHFDYTLAGPAGRGFAYAIDTLVRGAIVAVLAIAASIMGAGFGEAAVGAFLVAAFVLEWGYFFASELLMGGQSVGKKALHLRVVSADGRPLSASQSFLRNLLRAADFLPILNALGATVAAADARFRRLGDMVAGTIVVVDNSSRLEQKLELSPPATKEELAHLPPRVDLTPSEVEALELFLRRGSQLPRSRELELAELIAPQLARRFSCGYQNATRFLGLVYFVGVSRGRLRGRA